MKSQNIPTLLYFFFFFLISNSVFVLDIYTEGCQHLYYIPRQAEKCNKIFCAAVLSGPQTSSSSDKAKVTTHTLQVGSSIAIPCYFRQACHKSPSINFD